MLIAPGKHAIVKAPVSGRVEKWKIICQICQFLSPKFYTIIIQYACVSAYHLDVMIYI